MVSNAELKRTTRHNLLNKADLASENRTATEPSIAPKRRSGALTKRAFFPSLGECERYQLKFRMPIITITTEIAAPVETVFDLSRSIDLHVESTSQTNERAIAGRTSGLIELGETVTWEATHFFVRQRLSVRVTQFNRPAFFRDSIVSGAFSRFDHDHNFQSCANGTAMIDVFDFSSPLGPLGHLANWLFVTRHMRKLLIERNKLIKAIAESGNANRFIDVIPQIT